MVEAPKPNVNIGDLIIASYNHHRHADGQRRRTSELRVARDAHRENRTVAFSSLSSKGVLAGLAEGGYHHARAMMTGVHIGLRRTANFLGGVASIGILAHEVAVLREAGHSGWGNLGRMAHENVAQRRQSPQPRSA